MGMSISLFKKRGYKKVISEIQKLDSNLKVLEYKTTIYLDSVVLKAMFRYDFALAKHCVWIYGQDWQRGESGKDFDLPINFVECLYNG